MLSLFWAVITCGFALDLLFWILFWFWLVCIRLFVAGYVALARWLVCCCLLAGLELVCWLVVTAVGSCRLLRCGFVWLFVSLFSLWLVVYISGLRGVLLFYIWFGF